MIGLVGEVVVLKTGTVEVIEEVHWGLLLDLIA